MNLKNEKLRIILAGIIIGLISVSLVLMGNPANMGFCIACFLRDTAGALGLHRAEAVQYIRPEIIGLVLGAFIISLTKKEFLPRGGSSPITRFILGFFIMIGCLMFLGCPFRMILRIAGGDLNAIFGLIGLILGILLGIYFLNKGYSLKRTYKLTPLEGSIVPIVQIVLLIFLIAAPTFILFTPAGKGPGAKHAAILISLTAGVIVGILAQRTRLCMVGGIRDLVLFGQWNMLYGFISILISAFVMSLIVGGFNPGFTGQPVAHTDGLWNMLGMVLTGFGSVLLGGCPLRQLILTGEGNTDSAITVIGLIVGAAFAHNFALASSAKGPTLNGKLAVIIGFIIMLIIAIYNTKKQKA